MKQRAILYIFCCFIMLLVLQPLSNSGTGKAADLVSQAATDLEVLYLFDNPEKIDWPTLFYLNETYGARIDLLTVKAGSHFHRQNRGLSETGIFLNEYFLKPADGGKPNPVFLDSLIKLQFASRNPDVVIFADLEMSKSLEGLFDRIRLVLNEEKSIFPIKRIYQSFSGNPETTPSKNLSSKNIVTVNQKELAKKYRDRIALEVPKLFSWVVPEQVKGGQLMKYRLVATFDTDSKLNPDFMTGLERLRLSSLFETKLSEGAVKKSFIDRVNKYTANLALSRGVVGGKRAEYVILGFKTLLSLSDQISSESELINLNQFKPYMDNLVTKAQKAVLEEIGMDWDGRIILRDSPHGPKLKFRASLSVNGPKPIELSYIRFLPYWDTSEIVLDDNSRKIKAHQSFVREYLVDIDRNRLEATMPESLLFEAEIVYSNISMAVRSTLPIWESPDIRINFEPDFHFVKPSARVEVDKVVSSMNWKAVISKPLYSSGEVSLNLDAPRGLFAGAYKQTWQLEKGRATETVRIPFSISNLFELGIQSQVISLSIDDHIISSDTGWIRIASCGVADTIAVGLLPDSSGLLEDILRMANVNYRPLTNRTLETGDLGAYNVIVVGSGAIRDYPAFRKVKGRFEEFLRFGGSLVIMGQPGEWPERSLPVSFVNSAEYIKKKDILNRIPNAKMFRKPYAISESGLFSYLNDEKLLSAAVITPAERVFVTTTGATLLSVSRLGEGQIIFCGLPLVEMIAELNIEAIHLLANILNY